MMLVVFTVKRSLEIHRSRTFIICHSVNYSPLSTYCNVPTLQTGADTVCKTPFGIIVHVLLNIWQDVISGATRAQPADRPPAALLLHSQREADCSVRARWASGGTEVNVERSRLFRFLHHHHLQQHTARGWRSEATAARKPKQKQDEDLLPPPEQEASPAQCGHGNHSTSCVPDKLKEGERVLPERHDGQTEVNPPTTDNIKNDVQLRLPSTLCLCLCSYWM